MEAARRADLTELPVRVIDFDDWEATQRFVDEHIPIEGVDERGRGNGLYSDEEIEQALACLREEWPDERLRDLRALTPHLEAKLAARRAEGIRRGYVGDGRGR